MKDYYSRETLFFKFVNQGHHPSHLPPPSLFLPYSFSHFSPFITYYLQFVHLCPPSPFHYSIMQIVHHADCPPRSSLLPPLTHFSHVIHSDPPSTPLCKLSTQVSFPSLLPSLFLYRPPRSSYHSSHSPAHSFFIDYLRGDNFDMTQQHILNMTQILADLG